MPDKNEVDDAAIEERDYDHFFLRHLQSVHGNGAWYLNHRFIGKGGRKRPSDTRKKVR
jgi:hypothetical protein